jgi:hypothetical protein
MRRMAREFNLSETTFLLRPTRRRPIIGCGHSRRLEMKCLAPATGSASASAAALRKADAGQGPTQARVQTPQPQSATLRLPPSLCVDHHPDAPR